MKKRFLLSALLVLLLTLALAVHAQADGLTPSLTVNGGASASVAFNGAPTFRICAPGATGVRLLANRLYPDDPPQSWERYFDRYEVSSILEEGGMKMFDQGTWRVTADYTTDDYDDDVDLAELEDIDWTPIGSVTVQVENWLARLNPPSASLSASSVNRGGTVTVTVSSFQHKNEWYWMDLERKTGGDDWEFMEHIDLSLSEAGGVNTCVMPTAALEPGDYRLWVRCEAVQYEDNGTCLPFTVTADTAPELSFQLSQTKAVISGDITLFLYVPGADRMEVDIAMDGEPYWRDGRSCGGDTACWGWSCSDRGTYIFTPRAWKGDQVIEGSPVTLTVVAPEGDLDTPTLSGVPSVMSVGMAIEGSFSAGPYAEAYHIELDYAPQDGEWERVARFIRGAGDTTLSLPGALFARPGMYNLEIHANADGWNGGYLQHWILVTEPMEEALSLTFNGSADDVTGWLSHQSFHVDVEYPDNATALYILNDRNWEFFDTEDFGGVYWSYESGDHTLVALATTDAPFWRADGYDWSQFDSDALDWSMISNAVQVNVIAPGGRLDGPVLTVPETVQRGEWLRVNIGEVPNAEEFFLHVFHKDENGWEYGWEYNADIASAGEVLVPTATFEAGETLYIRVDAHAVGYDSSNSEDVPFTVTEGASTERFLVSDTDVLTRETVSWSVYAPGAERVRVVCDAELYSEEYGNSLSDWRDFDHPGNFELKALVPDGDGWRVVGEPVVVHVSAPYGDLPVEIDTPASVASNGTAEFTVTWRHGDVRALYETALYTLNWMDRPLEFVGFSDENGVATGTYRVRGEFLTPGETYIIETWLRPEDPGYSPTQIRTEIVVTSGDATGTVSVSKTELLRCESATVTVDVPGATALYVYHGDGHWDGFLGSHAEADWEFYLIGENRVYARYTTQAITDPENVDFESLDWEGTTPIATVRVNVLGWLNLPVYTLESDVVRRGQPFRFIIGEDQGLGEWYIGMLRAMDGREVSFGFWDEASRTVKVETVDVEPDLYYLELHGEAIGYESCDARLLVAAEEPEEVLTITFNGSADDVTGWLSHQSFHVDVEYPDNATALYILNDRNWEFFDTEDFGGVYWSYESGDHTLVALATTDAPFWRADGYDWSQFDSDALDWSMISNAVQVNVIAPGGRLDGPVLTVPETVQRGEWLRVNIGEVPNAEEFFLHVFHKDENGWEYGWEYNADIASAGEVLVPTATFEAGETLYIRVDAHAVGYDSSNSEDVPFTVTEGASTERFLVSDTDVLTRETVSWSVYAPGAERVRVVCDAELYSEEYGNSLSDWRDFDHPGNFELKALVPDGDGWRVVGEPVVVHVSAPYGDLPVEIDTPASVASNGTAEFTVTWRHGDVRALYETALYTLNWMDRPLEFVGFSDENGVATGTYRVRGEFLTPGETYIIETWLRPEDPGYSPTQIRTEIVVTSGDATGTVSVSKTELLRCESATVTVDVPGATALYVYHGDGHWDGFLGSHAEADWEFYLIGENRVYARYTTQAITDPENVDFESLDWEGTTPIATVRVNVLGWLNLPVYTLESDVVRRGQPFRFIIGEDQGLGEWYIGMLRAMDGREVSFGFWDEASRTVKVETVDVEPDLYYLELHGNAIGYESCDARLLVAVEEPEEGLTISLPETVVTVTRPLVTAYAPGAERITLTLTDLSGVHSTREYEQEGEMFREEARFGHTEGTWQAVFMAHYPDDRIETVEQDVQVIAPYGDLPHPTLRMDSPWMEGQDLRFMADAGEAMFIYVDILDRYTQEYVYNDWEENFGDWHYTIPADSFTPGHSYNVEIYSVKEGYNANETIFWIAPLPMDPATLILPAALTEIDAGAFEGVAAEKIVIPSTVTSVAANAFANCPNILVVEIAEGASGISTDAFAGSGAFMIYGHAHSSAEAYANANSWATFICLD